jgi:hypothetical protein
MASICQGIVLATKKKCDKEATHNGFCSRHQSQIFQKEAESKGETVCRMFDRGCRNYLSTEEKSANIKACGDCRSKLLGKSKPCEHAGCKSSTSGERFCGKHKRDTYREKEAAGEVKYCNIDRGCVSVLKPGQKKCDLCVNDLLKKITEEIKSLRDSYKQCLKCQDAPKSTEYFCGTCVTHIKPVKTNNSNRKLNDVWRDFKNGAVKRELILTVNFEEFKTIVVKPCVYCGHFALDSYNGIDRFDNSKGYISTNVKPCCTRCNMMKSGQTIEEFIDKVGAIAKYQSNHIPIASDTVTKWRGSFITKTHTPYNTYKANAEMNRKLLFELTIDEYEQLHRGTCYLCGIASSDTHKNGIDRVDSSKGYIMDNCRTCCTHCNLMKKDFDVDSFVNQCAQIGSYYKTLKSNQEKSDRETSQNRLTLTKEIYRATDIFEILEKSNVTDFIAWAKKAGKSVEFIDGVRAIDKADKTAAISEIKHQLDMERKRKSSNDDVKHMSGIKMAAMLMNGSVSKFKDIYSKMYDLSQSFETQLDELMGVLETVDRSAAIELCKKFLKAEASRRQSNRNTQLKQSLRIVPQRSTWVAKEVAPVLPIISIETPPVNTIVYNLVECPKKQWKAIDIYNSIKAGASAQYKTHCEANNDIKDKLKWEEDWSCFNSIVSKSENFESVKQHIESFIKDLRSVRHAKITHKDVLERKDREIWPCESILKAFTNDRMDDVKTYYESKAEKGPNWETRWEKLLADLGLIKDEKERLEIIRKFQQNHRTACYRLRKKN